MRLEINLVFLIDDDMGLCILEMNKSEERGEIRNKFSLLTGNA
jgi:hypothetical protein